MAAKIYKINYKSDFIITIDGDAGWTTPFCIKFWTGMPSKGYFVGYDGVKYVNCKVGDTPDKLVVLFDDHHMPIGELKMQIAYHTTIAEFPGSVFDEVTNARDVIVDIDGTEYQVMLDFEGETAPELEFNLPAYANEQERIQNELQRQENEAQRIQNELERESATAAAVEGAEKVDAELNGNTLTVTNRNGVSKSVDTKGETGERGPQGIQGPAGSTGVSITSFVYSSETETDVIYIVNFSDGTTSSVSIPKGEKGDTGSQGPQGATGATGNGIASTVLNNNYTLTITFTDGTTYTTSSIRGEQGERGPQGPQGNSGYTGAAGELEVVNNLTDGGATKALSAEMGKELSQDVTDLSDYVFGSSGVDVTYNQTYLVNTGQILKVGGDTRSFSGFKTSNLIEIPDGTRYLYTSNLYKNDSNTYIGLKFFTSNSVSSVISANVASSGQAIPTTIDMTEWPTAKYVRFCSNQSSASIRFYTEAGQSELIDELIAQETGQSTTKTISQAVITDALSDMSNDIAEITAAGVDTTFNSENSSLTSGTLLKYDGSTRSMAGYSTSALLNIPSRTQFLDTYGLYKNDANTYIGLMLYTSSGSALPAVCGSGQAIPATIDLSLYPTAAKFRWCTNGVSGAYVRCYSVSAIKTAVLGMIDDQTGDDDEALMSQKGITDALADMAEEMKRTEYVALQNDALTADSGNWTFGGQWTYSSNGATPPSTGDSNYMRNTIVYYSDRRFMRVRAAMGLDTKLILTCSYGSSLNDGEGASAFGIDFANKKLIIYGNSGYGGVSDDTEPTSTGYSLSKTVEQETIPDTMIGAREYVIELHKHGSMSKLVLMDTLTGNSVFVAHNGWACGRQNQLYGFYCESGTLPVLKNFGVYSLKNPDVVFTGDSITEGVYVSDRAYTYPNRYRSQYPSKNVVVSARGGQTITGLMSLFTSEWNIVRPKIISLLIGANGGNSSSTLSAFKDACDAIGAVLVMHYCSCRTDRDMADSNNNLIPALGVEGARFDKATAIDNTPNSTYSNINTELFGDNVHPNVKGQGAMFNRISIDCISMII